MTEVKINSKSTRARLSLTILVPLNLEMCEQAIARNVGTRGVSYLSDADVRAAWNVGYHRKSFLEVPLSRISFPHPARLVSFFASSAGGRAILTRRILFHRNIRICAVKKYATLALCISVDSRTRGLGLYRKVKLGWPPRGQSSTYECVNSRAYLGRYFSVRAFPLF